MFKYSKPTPDKSVGAQRNSRLVGEEIMDVSSRNHENIEITKKAIKDFVLFRFRVFVIDFFKYIGLKAI